jgi:hypothetical protein
MVETVMFAYIMTLVMLQLVETHVMSYMLQHGFNYTRILCIT